MKKQLFSFDYALKGIMRSVCTEAHLRFHLVAAFYVLLFSLFYRFSAVQTAILMILIALVIAFELLNTALENICDLVTKQQNTYVKIAKDAAAGAVLVLSIAAAAVAILFFGDFTTIKSMIVYFSNHIFMLILLIFSAVISVLFVWRGPLFLKRREKNKKSNKNE